MQAVSGVRPAPVFQKIKEYVLDKIRCGEWKEGDLIPTEDALTKTFGVSRMTVNRALRELTAEQVVTRIQGAGTYVAHQKYQATLVEIKNIADEIRARGHRHSSELHLLERVRAKEMQAKDFMLKSGAELFHSLIVHFENEVAIQVEDRWVNGAVAPDYMAQDFARSTPNEYLMRVAPLQSVQFRIEAAMPTAEIVAMLRMPQLDPCLVLRRKTFSMGKVASIATMWHPSSRYQFSGEI